MEMDVPEVENPNKRVPTAKNRQPTEPHTLGPKRSNTTPIMKSPFGLGILKKRKEEGERNTTNKQTVPAVNIVVKRRVCSPHYPQSLPQESVNRATYYCAGIFSTILGVYSLLSQDEYQ